MHFIKKNVPSQSIPKPVQTDNKVLTHESRNMDCLRDWWVCHSWHPFYSTLVLGGWIGGLPWSQRSVSRKPGPLFRSLFVLHCSLQRVLLHSDSRLARLWRNTSGKEHGAKLKDLELLDVSSAGRILFEATFSCVLVPTSQTQHLSICCCNFRHHKWSLERSPMKQTWTHPWSEISPWHGWPSQTTVRLCPLKL